MVPFLLHDKQKFLWLEFCNILGFLTGAGIEPLSLGLSFLIWVKSELTKSRVFKAIWGYKFSV